MKVLILTPFFPPNKGGAETFIDELTKQASKCHDVLVLTFMPFQGKAESYQKTTSPNGSLSIYRLGWLLKQPKAWQGVTLRNMFSVFPKMAFWSFWLQIRNKCEIVHSQGLLSGFVGVLLAKCFGVRHYLTLLALYNFYARPKWFRLIVRWMVRNSDKVFVEGVSGERDIRSAFKSKKQPDNIVRFNHWCDQERFKPPQKRDWIKKRILFVGRPIPEKGRHLLEEIEKKWNDQSLVFKYVDNVEKEALPEIYANSDVLVVPSIYAEGHTRVVVESSSSGCAVVATWCGSLREQVEPFGVVVSPENLDVGIRRVLGDLRNYQFKAYSYAKENFSEENAKVFLNEYEKTAKNRDHKGNQRSLAWR